MATVMDEADGRTAIWKGRVLTALLIVVVSVTVITLMIWLGSMNRWWADALMTYVSVLIMSGAVIGAYAGWALDEVDEPQEECWLVLVVGLIGVGLPLLVVLGKQALGVPFDVAPGTWPMWADAVARAMVSIPSAALAVALTIRMARTARRGGVWITGGLFFLALMLLAAWPWLGDYFPIWARVASLLGMLTGAVLFARTIQGENAASS